MIRRLSFTLNPFVHMVEDSPISCQPDAVWYPAAAGICTEGLAWLPHARRISPTMCLKPYEVSPHQILAAARGTQPVLEREDALRREIGRIRIHKDIAVSTGDSSIDEVLKVLDDELAAIRMRIAQGARPQRPQPPSADAEKIRWCRSERLLIHLFELLYSRGFISSEQYQRRFALIRDHFAHADGRSYNNKQLWVQSNQMGANPGGSDELRGVVERVERDKEDPG